MQCLTLDSPARSEHAGSASGRSAFTVQHDLTKSAPSGGVHALRRTATYSKAGGTTFHQAGYAYGSATINDLASRVASVTVGSSPTTVATYDYLGAGHLVGTTLDQANLNTSVFTESGGTHTYTDLDKFNRPTRWNWERVGGASGGFYNTAIAYDENSNPTSTTDDAHARNNSSDHPFDVVYGLDSLNRVISADEGNIASGVIESGTRTRKELWNSLSLTGNWGNRQLDANGDGDYGDESDRDEPSAYNTFNKANEWTARRVAKAGGTDRDEHAYTYDAVGNLTDLAMTAYRGGNTALTHRRLVYDAFGRLVRVAAVEGMDETDVALYRYNGLNMRLMWQDDADADSTLESSERFYVMHDERWRPVATFRDTDSTPKEAFVWHAAGGAGQGGFGGSSYIDSIILRDRDNYTGGTPNPMTSASDGTLEERRVFCQNWRADVVAITKSDGTPIEYVRYSAYGEPTVYPIADLNMDGVVNSTDSGLWSDLIYSASNSSVYAGTDLDFDGADDQASSGIDSDLFYESYNANTGLSGVGRVSSPSVGNRVGYAGYQWDQTISASHVRYRVYLPDIGRWTRRDPLGYVDGMGLYEYVQSLPVFQTDPLGLTGSDDDGNDAVKELERRIKEIEDEKARLRREKSKDPEDAKRIRDELKRLDEQHRQLKAERKLLKDSLKRNPRIPGKGDYGRNKNRPGRGHTGQRGFIGQGTALGIMLAGFYFLHDGAELLGDPQSRCHRYFSLLSDCAEGGSCSYLEIDSLGRECALEMAERLGKATWYSFTVFHDRVLDVLRNKPRNSCAE